MSPHENGVKNESIRCNFISASFLPISQEENSFLAFFEKNKEDKSASLSKIPGPMRPAATCKSASKEAHERVRKTEQAPPKVDRGVLRLPRPIKSARGFEETQCPYMLLPEHSRGEAIWSRRPNKFLSRRHIFIKKYGPRNLVSQELSRGPFRRRVKPRGLYRVRYQPKADVAFLPVGTIFPSPV